MSAILPILGRKGLVRGGVGRNAVLRGRASRVASLRAASQFNRVNTSADTAGANGRHIVGQFVHRIGSGDMSELRVLFNNVVWDTTPAATAIPNQVTIQDCFIQKDYGTTPIRVKFGGSNSRVMAAGEVDVLSDPILPAALSLAQFTKGDTLYIGVRAVVNGGEKIGRAEGTDGGTVEGKSFDPTVTTATYNGFGWGTTGTAPASSFGHMPMLAGKFIGDDPLTLALCCDSIWANGNRQSYGMRALRTAGLAGIQMGRIGGIPDALSGPYGLWPIKYCSAAGYEYDTNYIGTRTLAQLQAGDQAAWTAIRNAAYLSPTGRAFKIVRVALLLATTGNPATLGGQTVSAAWGAGGVVEQLNDWTATRVGNPGEIDAFIDATIGAGVRGGADRSDPNFYKWVAGMVVDEATDLHPSQPGSDALGDVLAAGLAALA
jgi:hypothetical protein